MKKKTIKFDIAAYLTDHEMMIGYLNEVITNGTTDEVLMALRDIAKAKELKRERSTKSVL